MFYIPQPSQNISLKMATISDQNT